MSNGAKAKEVKIGLITDTHYWQRDTPYVTSEGAVQLQPWSEQILNALLDALRAAQLDLVVHLGDLVCGGGGYKMPGEEYEQAMRYVHRRLHELDIPVVALPGNHDLYPGKGHLRDFYGLWQYQEGLGKTIDLPQAQLILLNTMGHSPDQIQSAPDGDPVYGMVSQVELRRLEDLLSSTDSRPALLFTHQVLLPWNHRKGWKDYYGVHNAQEVLSLIDRSERTRAVFQGHAHRLNIQEHALHSGRRCVFATLPGTIEYPVAWVQLSLRNAQARLQLQRLPLPEISAISARSGDGQYWREGEPSWWDYHFALSV